MKKFMMILATIAGLSAFEAQGSWMRFVANKALEASSSTGGHIFFGSLPLTYAISSAASVPERVIANLASTPIGKFIQPEAPKGWLSWGLDGCAGFASDVTKQILTMITISAVMGMIKSAGSSQDDEIQQQSQQYPRPVGRRIVTAQELAARRAGARA